MQRLMDYAIRGYPYHVSGTVPGPKVRRFVTKMADRYHVHLNRNQRHYRRNRKGDGVAVLILFPHETADDWRYWLLVSAGPHPAHDQEPLGHIGDRRQRLAFGDEFELARRTRPRAHGGGGCWTWQLTADRFATLQDRARRAARQPGPRQLLPLLGELTHLPGFGGIRSQVAALHRIIEHDWRRHHRDPPPAPPRLPYVSRRRDQAAPLSSWLS